MTQEQEIKDIIKKNLPEHVGEILKERLAQAEADSKKVEELTESVSFYINEIKKLDEVICSYQKSDSKFQDLDSRENKLEKERNSLEIEKLKYQLSAEKDKAETIKSIALGLVRNTEYRKEIFDSENVGGTPVIDGQGNYHYPQPTSRVYTETRREE